MRLLVLCIGVVLLTRPLSAQGSPYVPLDHWTMPRLEYLIRAGVIPDPSPLIRPFRRVDALRALAAADTVDGHDVHRRVVRELAAYFQTDRTEEVWFRYDISAGALAATHARRTAVRDSGDGDLWSRGWLAGSGAVGPVAFASRIEWDYRLKADPDYRGSITREVAIPNRFSEAYGSAQFPLGELFFGQMARNWGPTFVEGLILSPAPYSWDHFGARLGTPRANISIIAAQFDDLPNTNGETASRYFVLHNLYLRLPFYLTANIWEGTLFAGVNRQFEPWFLNPFKLANAAWRDEGGLQNNNLVGGDFELAIPRWPRLYFSLFIDDFPPAAGDEEPSSGGLTAGIVGSTKGVVWTAFYTAVANLTYRAVRPEEVIARRGVGLARNQSDYDQITVRLAAMPLPAVLLQPELTLIRQGEGDFRLPFPPASEFPTTPVLHAGVVERIVRAALSGRLDLPFRNGIAALAFDVGFHRFSNAGHVAGATDSRFVGSVAIDLEVGWSQLLWEP